MSKSGNNIIVGHVNGGSIYNGMGELIFLIHHDSNLHDFRVYDNKPDFDTFSKGCINKLFIDGDFVRDFLVFGK